MKLEKKSILARNIISRRAVKGWSQPELAHRAGVHANVVKKIETDRGEGEFETRAAIAGALGCDVADLYRDANPTKLPQRAPALGRLSDEEGFRIFRALEHASDGRRLAALYLLTKDDKYYQQALEIADAAPIVRVLKKVLAT